MELAHEDRPGWVNGPWTAAAVAAHRLEFAVGMIWLDGLRWMAEPDGFDELVLQASDMLQARRGRPAGPAEVLALAFSIAGIGEPWPPGDP